MRAEKMICILFMIGFVSLSVLPVKTIVGIHSSLEDARDYIVNDTVEYPIINPLGNVTIEHAGYPECVGVFELPPDKITEKYHSAQELIITNNKQCPIIVRTGNELYTTNSRFMEGLNFKKVEIKHNTLYYDYTWKTTFYLMVIMLVITLGATIYCVVDVLR